MYVVLIALGYYTLLLFILMLQVTFLTQFLYGFSVNCFYEPTDK